MKKILYLIITMVLIASCSKTGKSDMPENEDKLESLIGNYHEFETDKIAFTITLEQNDSLIVETSAGKRPGKIVTDPEKVKAFLSEERFNEIQYVIDAKSYLILIDEDGVSYRGLEGDALALTPFGQSLKLVKKELTE